VIIIPMMPIHVEDMTLQPGQMDMAEIISEEGYSDWLASIPNSYSLMKDGECLACGGIIEQFDGRALAWALISNKLNGTDLILVTKLVKRELAKYNYKRIEAIVRDGFEQGHRWARLLGFRCETPDGMLNWFNDGAKAYLYARYKL